MVTYISVTCRNQRSTGNRGVALGVGDDGECNGQPPRTVQCRDGAMVATVYTEGGNMFVAISYKL